MLGSVLIMSEVQYQPHKILASSYYSDKNNQKHLVNIDCIHGANCPLTSGTNNIFWRGLQGQGTRDSVNRSGTVPEIQGWLDPM